MPVLKGAEVLHLLGIPIMQDNSPSAANRLHLPGQTPCLQLNAITNNNLQPQQAI